MNYFAETSLFSCIANVHYHFGRTKDEFSTPALAADRFCLLRLYELRRGSLADISHGGCDRLEPSGKVRSCPLPDQAVCSCSSRGQKKNAPTKLLWPNCSLRYYIVEPFLTSCSPGYMQTIGAWPTELVAFIITARAATTQQLRNLRLEPLTRCRKLLMVEVNCCRRRFIGAVLPPTICICKQA